MNISDWVSLKSKSSYKGFIVYQSDDKISIRLTSPKELLNKVILVNKEEVVVQSHRLYNQDFSDLIDLALILNDKKWFYELIGKQHLTNTKNNEEEYYEST